MRDRVHVRWLGSLFLRRCSGTDVVDGTWSDGAAGQRLQVFNTLRAVT